MEYVFLISAIVSLIISLLVSRFFIKYFFKKHLGKVVAWFSIMIIGYIIISIFSFLWFFEVLRYDSFDYSLLYSLTLVVQTIGLFKSFQYFLKNKKIIYLLFFYLAGFFSIITSFWMLPTMTMIISFFLLLALMFQFVTKVSHYKSVIFIGIIYSGLSLVFTFLAFFGLGDLYFYSIISQVFLIVFIYIFSNDFEKFHIKQSSKIGKHKQNPILLFIKYFVFMIVIINLVLITTVSLHEFSHVVVSRFYGCEARSIVYEEGSYPYSEIICDSLKSELPIALSGPLVPIVLAFFLFIIGGRYIRPISFLMVGFNLLASYRDLGDVGISQNMIAGSSILGIILLLFGIALLARARLQEHRDHDFV